MKKRLLLLLMLMPLMVMGQGLTRDRVLRAMRQRPVAMGADNLFNPEYFHLVEGKRVGLVGNHSSLLGDGKKHLLDTLLSRGVAVCTLYSPEHGFRGTAEAGAKVDNSTDEKTGLPIVSLYGKNKKPLPEQLQGIDVMLFDLQDVGCRFYTYISTLHYVMESCAEHGIALVVLDRPNPHMNYVDGPVLEPQQQSFVGMHPVPIVYGMSIGEYARMILGEHWLWMTGNAKGKWVQLSDKE